MSSCHMLRELSTTNTVNALHRNYDGERCVCGGEMGGGGRNTPATFSFHFPIHLLLPLPMDVPTAFSRFWRVRGALLHARNSAEYFFSGVVCVREKNE